MKEEQILYKARELFFFYGLKTITVDEIAKASGVSKKTLYQSFSNKNDIVNGVVSSFINDLHNDLQNARHLAKDAVEVVVKSAQTFFNNLAVNSQLFFYELERSFPELYSLLSTYRKEVLHPSIINNLQNGISDGLFDQNLDTAFVADVRKQ